MEFSETNESQKKSDNCYFRLYFNISKLIKWNDAFWAIIASNKIYTILTFFETEIGWKILLCKIDQNFIDRLWAKCDLQPVTVLLTKPKFWLKMIIETFFQMMRTE